VVSDGCGSSEASEVGAHVTAEILTTALARAVESGLPPEAALARAFDELLGAFAALVRSARTLRAALLATAAGFCVTGDVGLVFAAGDGVIYLDGALAILDEANAPAYPAYAIGACVPFRSYAFDASAPFSLAVGTDGLASVGAEVFGAACELEGSALVRWLRRERDRADLRDDVALAVARRVA